MPLQFLLLIYGCINQMGIDKLITWTMCAPVTRFVNLQSGLAIQPHLKYPRDPSEQISERCFLYNYKYYFSLHSWGTRTEKRLICVKSKANSLFHLKPLFISFSFLFAVSHRTLTRASIRQQLGRKVISSRVTWNPVWSGDKSTNLTHSVMEPTVMYIYIFIWKAASSCSYQPWYVINQYVGSWKKKCRCDLGCVA